MTSKGKYKHVNYPQIGTGHEEIEDEEIDKK